jgi:hypothetical protein
MGLSVPLEYNKREDYLCVTERCTEGDNFLRELECEGRSYFKCCRTRRKKEGK